MKSWNKDLYIARQLNVETNEYGVDVVTYEEPKRYRFNYQPANGDSDVLAYGERVQRMYKMLIPHKVYYNYFNEGDLVYADGITPENETYNGEKANYRVYSIRPQHLMIAIYFEKMQK